MDCVWTTIWLGRFKNGLCVDHYLVGKVLKCTACGPLLVVKVLNPLCVDHFWL